MTVPDVPETEKIENPGLWEKLCDVVLDQLQITLDQLKIETSLGLFNWSLMDDLGADSIDTVEVIMAVEKEFDIEIPDSDAERLKTVGDFYEYLHPRPSLRDDFSALAEKSDAELWQIAQRQLPSAKLLRCQQLIGKHEAGEVLTSEEQRELDILIEEGDRLTAIKLEAYVLLKQSGQRLPNLGIFA
ncbi:acyl carrier protein [Candidatus Poribacteria bacterium]|nr:acyl carrier protein [Candidatus Poribacteria bacterium]